MGRRVGRPLPPCLAGKQVSLLSAVIAVALFPSVVGAQAPVAGDGRQANAIELDAVRVNAYRTTTHTAGATKTDTPVAQTPQSVSVIARDELDARGVQNLNEAMHYVAGVSLESTGIDNRVDDFRIRGFDAGSWGDNVTLDGMRAPQGSQFNRAMFDSWNLERVEVLKGPSAVMYGQVTPGGLVNQVSKTPQPQQAQQVLVGLDSHGQAQAAFDVGGGSADDRHLYRLVGLYRDGPTQIERVEQRHGFIAPSYSWQIAGKTRLTLLGLYQRDRGGATYQFLPLEGTLSATPYGRIKNTTFIGEPSWHDYDRDIWTAGWLFEHAFNDAWTLSQSARHTHVDSLYRTVITQGGLNADGRTQNRRAIWASGDSDGQTVDTRLQGKFATGALTHTVLFGVDWQKADWQGIRAALTNPPPIDVFQPVHTGYVPLEVARSLSRGVDRQTGIYLQDQVVWNNWRFSVGGRYDWTRDDTATARMLAATGVTSPWLRTDLKNEAFTGRAGALYVADNGLAPYLSYSESFQPSTANVNMSHTLSPFDPITGKQWEVGLKYQPQQFDGSFTFSAYDLRQQNILTDDPDPTHNGCGDDGGSQCQVQSGEGRVRGLELEARITPLDGFSLIGAVARMASKVTRDNAGYQGKRLVDVPDWTAALWGDYTIQTGALRGLGLALGMRYNGDNYGDSENLYRVPSYTVWDAAIRYDAGQAGAVSTQLGLNFGNLADKRYVSSCSGISSCHYGTGRTVVATARFSW